MTHRRIGGSADRSGDADERSVDPSVRRPALPPIGRLLGVDWGEKRIGLAISDSEQRVAQPLATLVRRAGRRFPLRAFRDAVDPHQPVGIVMGLPLESDGSAGEPAGQAIDTGDFLARATRLPVAFQDERMTTSRVRRAVAEMGGRTRGHEAELDRLAATVVLQAFLDGRR